MGRDKAFQAMLHFVYRDTLIDKRDKPLVSSSSSSESPVSDWLLAKLLGSGNCVNLPCVRSSMYLWSASFSTIKLLPRH